VLLSPQAMSVDAVETPWKPPLLQPEK